MKFFYDYFPIICFFIVYKLYGIYLATAATMVASFVQVGGYWLVKRRFEKSHLIMLLFILVLGGLTLLFHKEIFIKWKPTAVYWIFFAVLIINQLRSPNKLLLQRFMGEKLSLPYSVWQRLNLAWAFFFLFLGGLNVIILYLFDTDTWVNFKLFGTLGLTIIFVIIQAIYIARHLPAPPDLKCQ